MLAGGIIFGKQAAERTKRAVIVVEKMVQGRDPRQSRRPVLSGTPQGTYYCKPTSTIAAATGTWPNLTPGTGAYDVYQNQNGSLTLFESSKTIVNFYTVAVAANFIVTIRPNGYGSYDVIGQSCS